MASGIMFILRSLEVGGAERQLVALAKGLARRGHRISIVTYYSGGKLAEGLSEANVETVTLGKRSRWDILAPLWRLFRELRHRRPRIVHGYMPDGNLVATFVGWLLPGTVVVWGVRAADRDGARSDLTTRAVFRATCLLAWCPRLIIANSHAGAEWHVRQGYPAASMMVIANGIDTDTFKPDSESRPRVLASWELTQHYPIIGIVGRLDPVKGHRQFLRAAAMFLQVHDNAAFVCVGGGPAAELKTLQALARDLGVEGRTRWIGAQSDMPPVYSALDLLASASTTEGFANVIGEAMACDTICVVTDVGDSSLIVGDTGVVVAPGDAVSMAAAWQRALAVRDATNAPSPRERIVTHFGVTQLIERTETALTEWLLLDAGRDG